MDRKKRVVIALGGNALGNNLKEQMDAVKITASAIIDLMQENCQVIVTHGNGPQVGMINNAMALYDKEHPTSHPVPLSVCGAMSQAYIGYDLQNALREELLNRGLTTPVTTIVTQIRVDENDPAFLNPTKPIGRFMTKEEADVLAEKYGYNIMEDAGRGYRRVVASPKPQEIVEIESIRALMDAGQLVVCCGGGGIPVMKAGENHLKGARAVIDKDFASALLAQELDADFLIILTAVEKIAVNFNKPDQKWLDEVSIPEAEQYISEGHFAPGSMLPKVQAAIQFAASKDGRTALITLLEKAKAGVRGETGTRIHA